MKKIEAGDIVRRSQDMGEVIEVFFNGEAFVSFDNGLTKDLLAVSDLKLVAKKGDRKDYIV